jgi:RING-type zinc-finger
LSTFLSFYVSIFLSFLAQHVAHQMDNLVEEGTCPVCLEIYVDPHMLVCGHNVCLSCTKSIPRINNTAPPKGSTVTNNNALAKILDELSCPLCRHVTLKAELKPNIALRNMVDLLKQGKTLGIYCYIFVVSLFLLCCLVLCVVGEFFIGLT